MLIRLLICTMVIFASCSEEKMTICFTGDLLLDRGVREAIEMRGADTLFAGVSGALRKSDFVIANLECPVTTIDAPVFKKFIFRSEPEWLPALKKAGISHVVLANNHSIDQGRNGLVSTAENCVKHGLIPIGYNHTYESACSPVLIKDGNISVAVFSSVAIPLENWMPLGNQPSICQSSPEDMADNIRHFKSLYPEMGIVAVLHWGVEFRKEPEPIQRKQARMLIDAGADAVIGHHPHVVQSMEMYKGKPIIYSLGNFVFDHSKDEAKKGVVLKLSISNSKIQEAELLPYNIKRCAPVWMNETERKEFKEDLLMMSRGVQLKDKEMGWIMVGE